MRAIVRCTGVMSLAALMFFCTGAGLFPQSATDAFIYNPKGQPVQISPTLLEIFVMFNGIVDAEGKRAVAREIDGLLLPNDVDLLDDANAVVYPIDLTLIRDNSRLQDIIAELRSLPSVAAAHQVYRNNNDQPIYFGNRVELKLSSAASMDEVLAFLAESNTKVVAVNRDQDDPKQIEIVVAPEDNSLEAANSLHESGLVEYASPKAVNVHSFPVNSFLRADNYPNPCTDFTVISYSIAYDSPLSLTVHDLEGRKVAELLRSSFHLHGSGRVEFDTSQLPLGAYYYFVETPYDGFIGKIIVRR